MAKILIVDDDLALADVLAFTLRRGGFDVCLAHDGPGALEQFTRQGPDLVVLDWALPYMDGLQVCAHIRTDSAVPIIMLTVRTSDDDVVAALEAGADEFVTKPFSPRQLVARIRALLRRTAGEPRETLRSGALSLDVDRFEATWEGQSPIHLSRLETRLLQALLQNPGTVLTNESLIARVWGPEGASNEMLKQLIYRLRNKLEPQPVGREGAAVSAHTLIETIPNAGYVLNPPELRK